VTERATPGHGRGRIWLGVLALVLVVAGGAVYLVVVQHQQGAAASTKGAALPGGLEFVEQSDGKDTVQRLAPDGARGATPLRCQRVYSAAGTTVCLRLSGPGPSYEAAVFDAAGTLLRTVPLAGVPSRARVSASGKIVSWTVFVVGDSYATPGGFSTRTGYLDLRTGTVVDTLEAFTTIVDGTPQVRANANFWGMTVARDDRTFYATLGSGKDTWLMRGDLDTRTMRTVRTNAECPSLSPDQTRVAYKRRTGRLGAWQLTVLDLKTGRETILPGTTGVDDQAAWLTDTTLAYALTPPQAGAPSIYVSAADGTGTPKLVVPQASSPGPVATAPAPKSD
jgi:hypothetical protein